jgi:hypothetical protein
MSRLWRIAAVGVGLLLLTVGVIWSEFIQQPNRTVFFHLAQSDNPVIFGLERDELLRLKGRGAGRIRSAIVQQGKLQVQQYGISKQEDGRFRISPERKLELTQSDAPLVRFGATFIIP